ncbi:unnamed protein product [Sphenostylis stenocarpa]|uniref:Uncharacterized protein n=1 Tax=Sphenostylis stenocarpa TaxID=92480 RepID=A0AA86RR95_9FABA|nr:unnamed protein product [Sphenostylis stenocarpa]
MSLQEEGDLAFQGLLEAKGFELSREKNEMWWREYYLPQKQMEEKRSGKKGITKCYR